MIEEFSGVGVAEDRRLGAHIHRFHRRTRGDVADVDGNAGLFKPRNQLLAHRGKPAVHIAKAAIRCKGTLVVSDLDHSHAKTGKGLRRAFEVCVLYKARILRTENHGDFAIFLGIADIIGSFRQNKVIWIIGNCLVMVDD